MATRQLAAALFALSIVGSTLPVSAAAPRSVANSPEGSPKVTVGLISEPSAIEPGAKPVKTPVTRAYGCTVKYS